MIEQGYLYIETHPDHPEMIRVLSAEHLPAGADVAEQAQHIRYIARFKNLFMAQMQVHNTLRRQLRDINTHRYHVSLAEGIAAIEGQDLGFERVWIDPELNDASLLEQINTAHQINRNKKQRIHRLFQVIGGLSILLLLFTLMTGAFR